MRRGYATSSRQIIWRVSVEASAFEHVKNRVIAQNNNWRDTDLFASKTTFSTKDLCGSSPCAGVDVSFRLLTRFMEGVINKAHYLVPALPYGYDQPFDTHPGSPTHADCVLHSFLHRQLVSLKVALHLRKDV